MKYSTNYQTKKAALGINILRSVSVALLASGFLSTSALASEVSLPPSSCGQNYCDYFSFNTNYAISDILRFNMDNGSGGGIGWPFSATSGLNQYALGYGSPNGVNNIFFMGLATGLPGDTTGQQHAVLFTNTAFANSATTNPWGTLFPNTSETTLVTDLQTAFAPNSNPSSTTLNNAVNDMYSFGYGTGDAITGPNGPINFKPGSAFSIIAFSNGQIIGQGSSIEVAAVPEPGAYALMLAGLGLVSIAARHRKQAKG